MPSHCSMPRLRSAGRSLLIGSTLLLAGAGSLARASADDPASDVQTDDARSVAIRSLSSKPYLVSGGDSLIQIEARRHISSRELRVLLNGQDVTAAFQRDPNGRTLTGLVTGLRLGHNYLEVFGRGRHRLGALRLTNYPITGPMIAGPHLQPFICQTQEFMLADGTTLGPPLDPDCSAETRINYVYRSTEGGDLRPLPSPRQLPPDVAMTTTLDGRTVPFVVRIETGTMNRGI